MLKPEMLVIDVQGKHQAESDWPGLEYAEYIIVDD